jgi:hypothetical protein
MAIHFCFCGKSVDALAHIAFEYTHTLTHVAHELELRGSSCCSGVVHPGGTVGAGWASATSTSCVEWTPHRICADRLSFPRRVLGLGLFRFVLGLIGHRGGLATLRHIAQRPACAQRLAHSIDGVPDVSVTTCVSPPPSPVLDNAKVPKLVRSRSGGETSRLLRTQPSSRGLHSSTFQLNLSRV